MTYLIKGESMFGKENSKAKEEVKVQIKQEVKAKPEKKSLTQREAVYLRVVELLKESNVKAEAGKPVRDFFTHEQLNLLTERVMSDFKSGKTVFLDTQQNKEKLLDDEKLKKYVIGLCSNWFRKDPRLNGKNI
jgi:hypothetical protein